MNIQDIITYALVVLAAAFLIKKFFLKKKNKKGCGTDNNCKCG
ncbi:FeoB-associated Cys-rich membrane protein [Flavobacterium sp. I3-2]|nr:FeoB-associated Cys-rich membrane protein [Flavobacterium sp. I3-2]